MNFYVTITGIKHYFGKDAFQVGQTLFLFKEPNNKFDDEAIKVCAKAITVIRSEKENGDKVVIKMPHFETVGYIANSTKTVYKGTMSAGRIYDKIPDKFKATVMFITHTSIIAKVSLSFNQIFNSIMNDDDENSILENFQNINRLDDQMSKASKSLEDFLENNPILDIDYNSELNDPKTQEMFKQFMEKFPDKNIDKMNINDLLNFYDEFENDWNTSHIIPLDDDNNDDYDDYDDTDLDFQDEDDDDTNIEDYLIDIENDMQDFFDDDDEL